MRIGFFSVASISFGGGYEQQIVRLAAELSKYNQKVTLITLSEKATYKLAVFLSFLYLHPRFTFSELKKSKARFLKENNIELKYFSSLGELRKYIIEQDVVYCKNEIMDSILLRLVKIKDKPRLICGIHTLLTYTHAKGIHAKLHNLVYSSFIYTNLLQFYDIYHCINSNQKTYLEKSFNKKKIFHIPNFVDITIKRKKMNDRKQLEILFVGRLSLQKGTDTFINVIEKLKKYSEFSQMVIRICGSGEYENQIRRLASLYTNVLYLGFLSQQEMEKLYKNADILCTTSRGEAFPVACLEAQAYGLPIVGFNVAGVNDIISHNKNGFLVANENSDTYVQRILQLYRYKFNEKKKFLEMSHFAQSLAKKKYTAEVLRKQYLNLFTYGS